MPTSSNTVRIDNDLFGCKLCSGREFIVCRSEEEARYLRIFLDASLHEVYVPKDDEYLATVAKDLEKKEKKVDDIIDAHLDGVFNRKVREKVRHEVLLEVIG